MRKHVTPADPAASIPDPARGDSLPPEGRPVTWTAYWCALAMRGDVLVEELFADVPIPPAEEPSAPGIPIMITRAMRERLRKLGKTDDANAVLPPSEARALLDPTAD